MVRKLASQLSQKRLEETNYTENINQDSPGYKQKTKKTTIIVKDIENFIYSHSPGPFCHFLILPSLFCIPKHPYPQQGGLFPL